MTFDLLKTYWHVLPFLIYAVLGIKPRVLCMLSKYACHLSYIPSSCCDNLKEKTLLSKIDENKTSSFFSELRNLSGHADFHL